jgi:hypothetical protein
LPAAFTRLKSANRELCEAEPVTNFEIILNVRLRFCEPHSARLLVFLKDNDQSDRDDSQTPSGASQILKYVQYAMAAHTQRCTNLIMGSFFAAAISLIWLIPIILAKSQQETRDPNIREMFDLSACRKESTR